MPICTEVKRGRRWSPAYRTDSEAAVKRLWFYSWHFILLHFPITLLASKISATD